MSVVGPDDGRFEGGDDVLAGEYVLGVLDAEVRRAVEIRIARDPVFAKLVAAWQERLEPLDAAYEPVAPPRALYTRIEQRLFPDEKRARPGLWHSLTLWRGLAFASLLVTIGLLAATVGFRPGGGDTLTAELTAENSAFDLVAHYDAASGSIEIVPAAFGAPERQSLELWLIENEGAAPLSLGVIPPTGRGAIVVQDDVRALMAEGAILALSLEPEGGSPTGAPTGPVVASGAARRP
ncbi:anti-sigma factor [Pararhizobium haloflavum]|uniref:anti-sigma factor n=1 Tax=Pararhizobium haloflavum TaxID=2037914 RepID=UPI000C19F342|nr:anti-sigma factor [Pararhizobium haloflavum]